MSRTLVLKFGGATLASAGRVARAAARVRSHVRRGRRVAVVVSAEGDTTDAILGRANALGVRGGAADRCVVGGREGAARELDRALATGEDRAAALLAIALWRRGVPARSLRGGEAGIEAEGEFGGGVVTRVDPAVLRRLLDAGVVPVVSGFQGVRGDGETVTLGRGGSDISAVVLAAALGADCHIVKDVAGVYDRDPNVHPDARRFGSLGYGDLLLLAEAGAQVVHPAAVRLAASARVPLRVYHFAAPPGAPGGTRVGARRARVVSVARSAVVDPSSTAAVGASGGAA